MVDKYLELSGLGNRGLSVHKLRHTAATLMYSKGGVDVRVLKEILGHEQLNTTQIYTHVSNSEVEAAMAKNPLASLTPTDAKEVNADETVHMGTLKSDK
jgi:site-specific recombinase XerD